MSLKSEYDEAQSRTELDDNTASKRAPLRMVNLSKVAAQPINWLWKPFIAYGAFTLIDGEEGIGKSLLTLAIACAVANGKGFETIEGFEFKDATPGNVLLMSAEESLSFVVKPRLMAMNAPLDRFTAIDEAFTLDRDGFFRLEAAIAETNAKLVIPDPLFSYTGKTKLNDDNEIRAVTGELIRISEKFGCAILGVRHLNKSKGFGDARNAGLNGVGWRASARSALLVGTDKETGALAICQNKNNLAPKSRKSFGFKIESSTVALETGETIEVGKFHWTGESSLTEQRMLASGQNEDERGEKNEAIAFLRETLRDGERLSDEVLKEARKFGISDYSFRKAKTALGILSVKKGGNFGGNSQWFLSLPEGAEDVENFAEDVEKNKNQHLQQNRSNKTSYSNGLAEDVEINISQHFQSPSSTSSVNDLRQLMDVASDDDRQAMSDALEEQISILMLDGESFEDATRAAEAGLFPRWSEMYGAAH